MAVLFVRHEHETQVIWRKGGVEWSWLCHDHSSKPLVEIVREMRGIPASRSRWETCHGRPWLEYKDVSPRVWRQIARAARHWRQ